MKPMYDSECPVRVKWIYKKKNYLGSVSLQKPFLYSRGFASQMKDDTVYNHQARELYSFHILPLRVNKLMTVGMKDFILICGVMRGKLDGIRIKPDDWMWSRWELKTSFSKKKASLSEHLYFKKYACDVSVCSGWSLFSHLAEGKILKANQYCNHDNTLQINNKSRPERTVCSQSKWVFLNMLMHMLFMWLWVCWLNHVSMPAWSYSYFLQLSPWIHTALWPFRVELWCWEADAWDEA